MMSKHNVSLVAMMAVSIALLLAAMILSSMAADASKKGDSATSSKYSTISAVVSGLSALLIAISLGVYLGRVQILGKVGTLAEKTGMGLKRKAEKMM